MEGQRGRSGSGIYSSLVGALATAQLRRLRRPARAFVVVESSYWITTGLGAMLAPVLVKAPRAARGPDPRCRALGDKLQAAARERMRRM